MPEMIDVYDAAGERTGRVAEKHAPLGDGEYFLHTVALLRGRDGRYLLQQRSLRAKHGPGKWDVTGGGVTHGEDSRAAIAREVYEELGLRCAPEDFVFAGRLRQFLENGRGYLLDMYGLSGDFTAEECAIDPYEVNAVRMADYAEYRDIVSYNKSPEFLALQDELKERLEAGKR